MMGDSIVLPTPTSNTDDNYKPWFSLMTRNVSPDLLHLASNRFTIHNFHDQPMSDAFGLDLNKDLYTAVITKLPPNYTAGKLLDYIRVHFAEFIDGSVSTFEPYNTGEETVWKSSNPNSAIMRFRGWKELPLIHRAQVDDADVIVTNYFNSNDYASWTFHPVKDVNVLGDFTFWSDKGHPLGGNREVGIQKTGTNFTFYIQGVDRLWSAMDEAFVGRRITSLTGTGFFTMANELWTQVMTRVVERIHNLGGEATFNPNTVISNRIDYNNSVKPSDRQIIKSSGN